MVFSEDTLTISPVGANVMVSPGFNPIIENLKGGRRSVLTLGFAFFLGFSTLFCAGTTGSSAVVSLKCCSMYSLKGLNFSFERFVVEGRFPTRFLLIKAACLRAGLCVSAMGRTRKKVLPLLSLLVLPETKNSSSTSISEEYGS